MHCTTYMFTYMSIRGPVGLLPMLEQTGIRLVKLCALTLSRAQIGKSTVYGRWGLRNLNFVFIFCMATRLRMKLRIESFFTVIKLFWGVHVQVLAEIFAHRWAVALSQRLVMEAIGMQKQPWSTWIFLLKMIHLTALEWCPMTMAVPSCFQVTVGLRLAAQSSKARAK